MKARHHASGDTTVTYAPPSLPGFDIKSGGADLAWSGVCHFCNVTHISVLRAFPVPYRCSTCAAIHAGDIPPNPEKPGPTLAQAALLARIVKVAARIAKLTHRLELERVQRDELFVKAQEAGLTSREIGAVAGMSSPGVVSGQSRGKERRGS